MQSATKRHMPCSPSAASWAVALQPSAQVATQSKAISQQDTKSVMAYFFSAWTQQIHSSLLKCLLPLYFKAQKPNHNAWERK